MAIDIVPTTELNAVNEILTTVGTMPVNTLENVSRIQDGAFALDTLRNVAREVQSQGWWFNRSYNVSLNPSGGEIVIGDDILAVKPSLGTLTTPGETESFILRKGKLFKTNGNSSTFASPVLADITYLLDFEELPESARRFITIRAAKITQTKILGADSLHVFNEASEADAWAILEDDELEMNPVSSLYTEMAKRRHRMIMQDPNTRVTSHQQRGTYAAT